MQAVTSEPASFRASRSEVIATADLQVQKSGAWHPFEFAGVGIVAGYDGIRVQLAMALDDQAVRAIVLDVDSGGGTSQAAPTWPTRSTPRVVSSRCAILPENACVAACALACGACVRPESGRCARASGSCGSCWPAKAGAIAHAFFPW